MMNQELGKFYEDVTREFIERLNKRYENREGLDSNLIQILHTKLNEKMKKPHKLFHKALIDQSQQSGTIVIEIPPQTQKKPIPILKSQPHDSDIYSDEESDDLQKFQKQKEQNNEVKIENVDDFNPVPIIQKKQMKEQDIQDEQDSVEDQIKKQKMDKAFNEISMHIVGTYSTKSKKHRARDETTKMELENVFIKVNAPNYPNQIYFNKITCEFTKSQVDNIRL